MGRSKSPWRFSAERDVNAVSFHPYAGLPLEWMTGLVTDGNDFVGNVGQVGMFDHFTPWRGPVAEGAAGGWTLSGATGAATIVLGDTVSGEIILTADSTGGCNPTLALGGSATGANFLYTVGKRIWCFCRVKLQTVASQEFFFGLATPDTAPNTSDTFPSDGIFLAKASSDTNMTLHARKDGTSTTKTLVFPTVMADATYVTMGFRVLLNGDIMPYQNGIAIPSKAIAVGSANMPTAAADILQFMTGTKGASLTATYDWIAVSEEI